MVKKCIMCNDYAVFPKYPEICNDCSGWLPFYWRNYLQNISNNTYFSKKRIPELWKKRFKWYGKLFYSLKGNFYSTIAIVDNALNYKPYKEFACIENKLMEKIQERTNLEEIKIYKNEIIIKWQENEIENTRNQFLHCL